MTNRGVLSYLTIMLSFTAGTAFLMWLGEQITEKGVGNGISLIIFAGIVSRGPQMFSTIVGSMQNGALNWFTLVLFLSLIHI